MKEVKIDLKINDYELTTTGYINNNILSFKDKDEQNTNIIYDFNNNTLIRNNQEIQIKLFFEVQDNNVEYLLKENNKKFYMQLEKISLHKDKTSVIIKYRIEDTDFILNLSYMEA